MYLTIPVLISRYFDEVEAREAGVPEGKERDAREIESELEALLAPHDAETTLNIPTRGPASQKSRTVPNYNARFDFWEVEGLFFERHSDRLAGVEVECMIYPQKVNPGQEVIAATDVPPNLPYDALVTPAGRYHDLWTTRETSDKALARKKAILREHSDCLAVVCKAHV